MEYYSAIESKGIMNFTCKWIELENIILSNTGSKGHAWYVLLSHSDYQAKCTEYP